MKKDYYLDHHLRGFLPELDLREVCVAVWLEASYLRYATQANRSIWARSMAERLAAEIP